MDEQPEGQNEQVEEAAPAPAAPASAPRLEVCGLISMILGIISLPMSLCCSFISAIVFIPAIVLGMISIRRAKNSPGEFKGAGMGVAGLVCGPCSCAGGYGSGGQWPGEDPCHG